MLATLGKNPSTRTWSRSSRASSVLMVPPTSFVPLPSNVIGRFCVLGDSKSLFLRDAALMPQAVQLPGVDAMARGLKALLQNARQRQIHVVAAQQDVIANGDAFQRQVAVLLGNHDQAEIRGAAAHVAHQNEVADLDAAAPGVALAFEPRVKGCLRLFQQRDLLIAGLFGGAPGQLACFFVERSGHREQHVLFRESEFSVALLPRRCPTRCASTAGTAMMLRPAIAWAPPSGACHGRIGAVRFTAA